MSNWIYILASFLVTYLIRALPVTLIRRPINSRFIRSFLYYVPYVTLAVMTFPAIYQATQNVLAGIAALIIGIIASWRGRSLIQVAALCCGVVFVMELILIH